MAYNKKNYYKTVIAIQNRVRQLKMEDGDLMLKEIYWKHIYGKMAYISYRTFGDYLGVPAQRELKKIKEAEHLENEEKNLKINQLSLFNNEKYSYS